MIRYLARTLIVTGLCALYGCATEPVAAPQAPPAIKANRVVSGRIARPGMRLVRTMRLHSTAVVVALQAPAKGTIKIVSTPPGGRVLIDGIAVGKTPMVKNLAPNTYWITIEKEGFKSIERTVEVASGRLVLVSDTFHKEEPKPDTVPVVEERRVCPKPVGTFVQSCRNIVVSGCRLTADCARSNGLLVAVEYDLSLACRSDLSNCEGRLVCGPCR